MKILFTTAHPDDMETAVGGLVCRLTQAGHQVSTIVATSGRKNKKVGDRPMAEVREEESRMAHDLVGARLYFLQSWFPLELETGSLFDTWETRELLAYLINSEFNPDAVFTFWPVDVHPDHRVIGSITMNACLQKDSNREILCFEVWAGTTSPYPQSLHFHPTHYADITDVLDRKKEMLFCHKSQNPQGLWDSNIGLWGQRALEYKKLAGRSLYGGEQYMEAYTRLTRHGQLHPELAKFLIAP